MKMSLSLGQYYETTVWKEEAESDGSQAAGAPFDLRPDNEMLEGDGERSENSGGE